MDCLKPDTYLLDVNKISDKELKWLVKFFDKRVKKAWKRAIWDKKNWRLKFITKEEYNILSSTPTPNE